jgi:hypothetical protein
MRHLNALDGRWLNRDPINDKGGLNLLGYVKNNPIGFSDYLGLICEDECSIGDVSDVQPTRVNVGPFDPDAEQKVEISEALINAMNSMPRGLSYADMAEWLLANVGGTDITMDVIVEFIRSLKNRMPGRVYITFEGKKCAPGWCCIVIPQLKKVPCRAVYTCSNGPISGYWLPGTRINDLDPRTLSDCYKEAMKAFNNGTFSCK